MDSMLPATLGVTIPRFSYGSVSPLQQKVDIDTNIYSILAKEESYYFYF
jgi:hypothetical protein